MDNAALSYRLVIQPDEREAEMSVLKINVVELINTDPLAQAALVGLVLVLVVTFAIFGFVITRRAQKR